MVDTVLNILLNTAFCLMNYQLIKCEVMRYFGIFRDVALPFDFKMWKLILKAREI